MIKFNKDWRPKKELSMAGKLLSPVLMSDRLILKPPAQDDYFLWRQVREKNRDFLKPFEPEWPKDCLTQDFYKRRLQRQDKDRQSGCGAYFFLHHAQSLKIIGGLNLNNIQMGAACHACLGYWLDDGAQGQGYMSEALSLIIPYSFNAIGLKRLNAACLIDNSKSANMLLKLGFEEEGTAKKYFEINGKWQDHRLFGLCAS